MAAFFSFGLGLGGGEGKDELVEKGGFFPISDTTIFSVITGNSLILGSGIMIYVYFAGMVHAIFYKFAY